MASPIAVYRCLNKRGIGHAVYTNMVPAGGFRGYGSSQTTFAIECAIDSLARKLSIDPFTMRRKNVVQPGDNIESIWKAPSDASFGSYGIGECLDIVERALAAGNGVAKPEGADWAEGRGVALAMLECGPPTEHRSGAEMRLLPDGTYHLACGSTEMGNGITTAHKQIAASVLGTRVEAIDIINADTDRTPYDTGTFASTGTVVGGKAVHLAAQAMAEDVLDFASRHAGVPRISAGWTTPASSAATGASHSPTSTPRGRRSTTASWRAGRPTCRHGPSRATCRACASRCTG